jgi:hypothetical protein
MFRRLMSAKGIAWFLCGVAVALVSGQAMADVTQERADVVGQGMAGPVVASNGAKLIRSDSGLTADIRIPTPQPGSYAYPTGNAFNPDAEPGHPEVYSLWVFVFNHPEDCQSLLGFPTTCDLADFQAGRGAPGAFNAGGHVVGGAPHLQLSGHVSLNSEPFAGLRLTEPRTAEVHFAIAPHGALSPEHMPSQIQTPIGSVDFWWLAFFAP